MRQATEVDALKRLLERCTDEEIYLSNQRVDSYCDKKLLI